MYLPSDLKNTLSKDEIRAIVLHEQQHRLAFDPLKSLIVTFINQFIPPFPFKTWIFGYLSVLSELAADAYAEKTLKKRLPIISALYKQKQIHDIENLSTIGFSNSQSERIHILVGSRKINIKTPFLISFVVAATLFTGTALIKDRRIFYSCEHLGACVDSVLAPKKTLLNIH